MKRLLPLIFLCALSVTALADDGTMIPDKTQPPPPTSSQTVTTDLLDLMLSIVWP